MAARNRLPPGSSQLMCFPQLKKGFVSFEGFVRKKTFYV